ncbi:hypothetical protein AB0N24_18575 [Arthrobacter sp. NPDC093128]|uniref:hypothetical protein n=1 Tax=Arthrobacter sp. NPDC093128 TaxID=3154979 RepID=UPI0034234AAF
MTESTVKLFEEFTQSLRRNVGEGDEALEAIDDNYAQGLATSAGFRCLVGVGAGVGSINQGGQ